MRKISFGPIAVFSLILFLAAAVSFATTAILLSKLPLGDFRGLVLLIGFIVFLYAYSLLSYRLFLRMMPIKEGPIARGSSGEFGYHVYLLFKLILFFPVIRTKLVPVPFTRLIYRALGARLGQNTFSGGTILDPPLTIVGRDTIIGEDALLYSHAIEGSDLSHAVIRIGDRVTLGAKCIVMSGVTIGDEAIVAAGSVVLKHTKIGPGEVWAGVPAKRVRRGGSPLENPSEASALQVQKR
jgi:acetyltransferase-like isoleucine patch superfamily enzyme